MTKLHQTVHAEVENANARQGAVVFHVANSDNRFVQLSAHDQQITVESVSNANLIQSERLTPTEAALLNQLGWAQSAPDENFSRIFPQPANLEDISRLLTTTLQNVFHATEVRIERIDW